MVNVDVSLRVTVPVHVVYILTEELRSKVVGDMGIALEELSRQVEDLESKKRGTLLIANAPQQQMIEHRQRIDHALKQIEDKKQSIQADIERLNAEKLGAEVGFGSPLNGSIEVVEGLPLEAIANSCTVVLKGGVVQEVRLTPRTELKLER